eukprot:7997931-Pyramimonas_sp.AAC.2
MARVYKRDSKLLRRAHVRRAVQPFPLSAVTLPPGSRFDNMQRRNLDFLMGLNTTRLLCLHTMAANVTTDCDPYDHPQYATHPLSISRTDHYYNIGMVIHPRWGAANRRLERFCLCGTVVRAAIGVVARGALCRDGVTIV